MNILDKFRRFQNARRLRRVKSAMGSIKCVNGKIMIERIAFDDVVVQENSAGHIVIKPSKR